MPSVRLATAWTLTALLAAFLAVDAVVHLAKLPVAVEASEKAGWSVDALPLVGAVEAACLALYLVPRTSRLGAVLFTGYLGGASALNLMTGQGWFPVVFAPALGLLLWVALALRDPGTLAVLGLGRAGASGVPAKTPLREAAA